jgi:hypothetical protein
MTAPAFFSRETSHVPLTGCSAQFVFLLLKEGETEDGLHEHGISASL